MSDDLFDLDAVANERADQLKPFRFRFGGETFEFPAVVDVRVGAELANDNLLAAVGRLLGDEQFERFQAVDTVLDHQALLALWQRYAEHIGASSGKSPA